MSLFPFLMLNSNYNCLNLFTVFLNLNMDCIYKAAGETSKAKFSRI